MQAEEQATKEHGRGRRMSGSKGTRQTRVLDWDGEDSEETEECSQYRVRRVAELLEERWGERPCGR